jgi:hypothetical protein
MTAAARTLLELYARLQGERALDEEQAARVPVRVHEP